MCNVFVEHFDHLILDYSTPHWFVYLQIQWSVAHHIGREDGLDYNCTMSGKIDFECIGSIYLLVEVESNIGNPLCILLHLLWKPSWCDMAHEDTLVDGSVSGSGEERGWKERGIEKWGQREGNGGEERGSRRMREKEMTSVLLSWYLIRIRSVENKTKKKIKKKIHNPRNYMLTLNTTNDYKWTQDRKSAVC